MEVLKLNSWLTLQIETSKQYSNDSNTNYIVTITLQDDTLGKYFVRAHWESVVAQTDIQRAIKLCATMMLRLYPDIFGELASNELANKVYNYIDKLALS